MGFYQDGQRLCTVLHHEHVSYPPIECDRSSFYTFTLTRSSFIHHAYGGSDHIGYVE
jgi:hypothetical protein